MLINKASIGQQLKELRKAQGWTQSTVADKVELSRPAISNIEAGRRALTLETLTRFCELYKIDISYFGIDTENFDETQDLTARLEKIFNSNISDTKKDELYREIMKIYLDSKK